MSETRYTQDHEWLRRDDDGLVTVGITDHAQDQLGDVVFVQLPEVGAHLDAEQEAVVIESVKAAGEIHLPAAAEVVAVNAALGDDPGRVNQDPQGEGWMLRVRFADAAVVDGLMDEAAYRAFLG
ncbi:MAG: glycine cleavage system protein GcvH [Pseudomonadota bacterium]|nr:glycine cleavage system protein GcvH [Pseudomonadota bacterium]